MATPVTGPYNLTITRQADQLPYTNVAVGHRSRTWYRQKRPYNLDLAFTYSDRQVYERVLVNPNPNFSAAYNRCDVSRAPTYTSDTDAQNKALGDFREKISTGASWALTLAQRRQAMSMMTNRIMQMFYFVRALKRGQLVMALDHLGLKTTTEKDTWRRFKRHSGDLGSQILEFRFGWQPLWQDIHNTAEILSSEIKTHRVIGKGTSRIRRSTDASDPPNYYGDVSRTYNDTGRYHCKVWADVEMTNPNLALLNNLGMVNPVLVAYDAIPWSFVLNYFISLEEFCSNFAPYAGYTLTNQGVSHYQVVERQVAQVERKYYAPTGNRATFKTQSVFHVRTVGTLPSFRLRIRDPWDLKPGRALNAVGLLLQQLGKRA